MFKIFLNTAFYRILGRGIALLLGLFLARTLGPEVYGRYSFIISIITVACIPCVAGIPQLLIKNISIYLNQNQFSLLSGILKWSNKYVLLSSIFVISVLTLFIASDIISSFDNLLFIALFLVPFRGIVARQSAIFNAIKKPVLALIPTDIFIPSIILLFSLSFYVFTGQLNLNNVLLISIISWAIGALFTLNLLNRKFYKSIALTSYREPTPNKTWVKAIIPFTIIATFTTLSNEISSIMLGTLGNEESVGFFRVAMQGVALLALSLNVVNSITAPYIAELFKKGDLERTQHILRKSVRLSTIVSAPIALCLIVFSPELITFLFGAEYLPAVTMLRILCLGQAVNVICGSVGLVLNMTGNEQRTLQTLAFSMALNFILLFLLVPSFGGVGASIAACISMIFWNVAMAFSVFKLTSLKTWLAVK